MLKARGRSTLDLGFRIPLWPIPDHIQRMPTGGRTDQFFINRTERR